MNAEDRASVEGRALLLFDGLCGMCHATVRFLIRRDPCRRLLYAPLQSALGHEMLAAAGIYLPPGADLPDGVVLIESALTANQTVSTRSDAIIRAVLLLHGRWRLAARILLVIPRGVREWAYGWVARWRYRLFGAFTTCPLPSASERSLILGTGA